LHGKPWTLGNGYTLGKGTRRTAKMFHTAMIQTHGKASNARQRSLPCVYGTTHGKEFVAVRDVAVFSLPCVDARQRLCRVFLALCRARSMHGKALFSGSDYYLFSEVQTVRRMFLFFHLIR
jgi:hypothetical protein